MSYLYELHCHTSEVSGCGKVSATEAVELLKLKHYSGVVITDHMTPNGFENNPITDWKEYIDRFLVGYKKAKKEETEDFTVLLGAEIRFPENNNDYLLYGLTEDFLYNNPYINRMKLSEFRSLADKHGILIVQAHPLRNSMVIMNPSLLDGYEVYNGNMRHNSRNDLAFALATLNQKLITSGSDFHQYEDLARGGVFFEYRLKNSSALACALASNDYELKRTD